MLKPLLNLMPLRVGAGPFKGTKCLFTQEGMGIIPKLAGTYEMEIFPAFEHAIQARPELVLDIGAAEGFFVAGLARRLPDAHFVGFEAKASWQNHIRRLLEINGAAPRCEIRGFCDQEAFHDLLTQQRASSKFILMDIEGGEYTLLTPEIVHLLANAELIVELHDDNGLENGDALVRLFSQTHHTNVIFSELKRTPADVVSPLWKVLTTLLAPLRRKLDETRGYKMRWLHAVPKAG